MDNWKLGSVYFIVLGAVVLWFGCWELGRAFGLVSAWATGWLKLAAEGMNWMCIWRGVVAFLSGLLIMFGAIRFSKSEGFGTLVIGIIMLWILAGSDILKMILTSITGGGMGITTFYAFLENYAPPYPAAVWLLPFSLVIIYFISGVGSKKVKL